MKCFKCERAAPTFTLYRVNAKGRPGIWACSEHRIEPDKDLDAIVKAIEQTRAAMVEFDAWKVQIFGQCCDEAWEISVVRESNKHGQHSWGWFGEDKLLVSHNGGPCRWQICGFVWDQQIAIATELCRRLNAGEDVSA